MAKVDSIAGPMNRALFHPFHPLLLVAILGLACQPSSQLTDIPVVAGDLILVSANPFPENYANNQPDISAYELSEDSPPKWKFIESRSPESQRLSWVSTNAGGLVVATSTRVESLLIWRISISKLKGLSPQQDGLVFRIRGDEAPLVDNFEYRCFMDDITCKSTTTEGFGPEPGGSCTLDKFGEGFYYVRQGEDWLQQDLPTDVNAANLNDYALESYQPRMTVQTNCLQTPWDF